MTDELFNAVSANLEAHESRVLSIYPDSKFIPTCGVGHALFTPVDAYRVIFWKETDVLASRAEVLAAWKAVKFGHAKRALMMSFDESDRVLKEDLVRFERVVTTRFPVSVGYPLSVQVALYDIAVNCGSFVKWPHFSAHIDAREFGAAAQQSHRPDVGATRNQDTYNQLAKPS